MKRLLFLFIGILLLVGCQDEQSNKSQNDSMEKPSEITESDNGESNEEVDNPNDQGSIYASIEETLRETQDVEPNELRIGPVHLEDISVSSAELQVTEVSKEHIGDQSDYLHVSAEITIDEDAIPSGFETSSYFDYSDFKLETNTGDLVEASDYYTSRLEFYVITGFAEDMPLDLYFPIDEDTVDDITSGTVTILPPKDYTGELLVEEEVEFTFEDL
ncbi:hypothetical protein ACUL41_18980 [Virgibacillus natechei]